MRRLTLLLFSLLLVPSALAGNSAGDGSLVVKDVSARIVSVYGSGLIYGHVDQGTVIITEYKPATTAIKSAIPSTMTVTGSNLIKLPAGTSTRYFGSDIRFVLPNGSYKLQIDGVGIDISAVGKGTVSAIGTGTFLSGTLATNGGKPLPLGSGSTTLVFGAGKAPNAVPRADAKVASTR
jgi:hypothetical protein